MTLIANNESGLTVRKKLNSLFPGYYFRDTKWAIKGMSTAAHRYTLKTPNMLSCTILNSAIMYLESQQELALSASATYDRVSVTDWAVAANRAGKQFFVYVYDDLSGTIKFVVSDNATLPNNGGNPNIYTTANTRRIASFHCLCADVGTISGHTLTGFAAGDILPYSISDLLFEPDCVDISGMVYDPKGRIWVDIYLASGTGASTASINGATISDTRNWMDFVDDFGAVGKKLLTDIEFQLAAAGSNEETNIVGSADPVTTGGHSDTVGRRMISNIGCEDMCGALYQWLETPSVNLADGTAGIMINLPGSKGSLYTYGTNGYGNTQLLAGGAWDDASACGSRFRLAHYCRWATYSGLGGRGAARSRNSIFA